MQTKNYRIFIVDDDPRFHQKVRQEFARGFEFDGAIGVEALKKKLGDSRVNPDLFLLDLVLDDSKERVGLKLIPYLQKERPDTPIIVVTIEEDISTVVEAIKRGATDFLPKGEFEYDYWTDRFREAIERKDLKEENIQLKKEVKRRRDLEEKAYSFIGESDRIKEIKRMLRLLSEEPDITLLITGETGVGKEVAARYLHKHSIRKDKPFQAVNLSAVQKELLESELFGHVKGAFTGASKEKEGYFNQADGGVLMLDEIGDIDANIQIKLLRFLETKLIRPVGADKDVQLDIQIVTATHRDLRNEVEKRRFREDLYHRLTNLVIEIPPLRQRREDISLILQHFLGDVPLESLLSPKVLQKLMDYSWPGNIRELRNTMSQMILQKKLMGKTMIDMECLPADIRNHQMSFSDDRATVESENMKGQGLPHEIKHALIDLERIEKLLVEKNGVKGDVAEAFGCKNTDNLRYLIQKYYKKYPIMFERFSEIRKNYGRLFNR